MGCFNAEEIEAARNYRYNGLDASIAVRLFYRRFWDYMIQFVPLWVAPNLLTFIGFLLEITSFILSVIFSDGLRHPLPRWLCLLNAIFVFGYQTLDNLDGRQARRTRSSSALGQFFDHGCDAITGVSELIKFTATFNLSGIRSCYFVFLLGIGFFITSWQEYVTHFFYLGYLNAPDEGLGVMIIFYILMAIDPTLIRFADSKLWDYFVLVMFGITFVYIAITTIITALKKPEQRAKVLPSTLPGLITSGLTWTLLKKFPGDADDPFFIMSAGYVLQYVSQIFIVARLTDRPVRKLFDPTLIVMWIGQITYLIVPGLAGTVWFWKVFFVIVIGFMIVFDIRVALGFADALHIRIFSLKKLD